MTCLQHALINTDRSVIFFTQVTYSLYRRYLDFFAFPKPTNSSKMIGLKCFCKRPVATLTTARGEMVKCGEKVDFKSKVLGCNFYSPLDQVELYQLRTSRFREQCGES